MLTMVMSPTLMEMCSSCSSRWCWWTRGWGRPRFHCLCHVFCFHIPWCLWLDLAFVEKYRKYSASTSNNWWLVYVVFFLFFCCITCKRWLLRHAPLVLGRGLEPRSKPYLGLVDPYPKPCSWEGWYILSPPSLGFWFKPVKESFIIPIHGTKKSGKRKLKCWGKGALRGGRGFSNEIALNKHFNMIRHFNQARFVGKGGGDFLKWKPFYSIIFSFPPKIFYCNMRVPF